MSDRQTFYFAYGSNLDIERMTQRTGAVSSAGVAKLTNYRLAFNKRSSGGVCANIVADKSSEVWGVVYHCSTDALNALDRYEGVSKRHYRRAVVNVTVNDGPAMEVLTYVAGDAFICDEEQPSDEYIGFVLRGAQFHGLPKAYVRSIQRLAGVPEDAA